jgi:hypothetical protein
MQAAASVPEVLYPGAVVSGHGVGFELPTAHVQLHQSHGGGGGGVQILKGAILKTVYSCLEY